MILNFRFLFFIFLVFSELWFILMFCILCVSVFLLCMYVCCIVQMPIIRRFCLFFCRLFHFNLVLVVFITFIVYSLKMSLKISRAYFPCYLVIFNIKKFAFLRNSVLLCGVIVVYAVYLVVHSLLKRFTIIIII